MNQLELTELKAELLETNLYDGVSKGLVTQALWSLDFIMEQGAATEGLLGEFLQVHARRVESGLKGRDNTGGFKRPGLCVVAVGRERSVQM